MNTELKNQLMKLNSETLVRELKNQVGEERKLKAKILHYLWVIQQKRIFAEFGYPSLFEFCLKHLGYTEAESQRRISAMRLMGEIPEVESKISEGTLSLSALAMAQTLFRQEAKNENRFTQNQKIEVLTALENKSVRQCEREILKYSSRSVVIEEKIKQLKDDRVEISFPAPQEFVEKLERLKALQSHKNIMSTFEIFNQLLDQALQKQDPDSQRAVSVARQVTKTVSAQVRRNIWKKYDSRCSFIDPQNGQRCHSKFFLEIEHIKPKACGGSNQEENLRLYCRAHNQLAAIKQFGFESMSKFINPSKN